MTASKTKANLRKENQPALDKVKRSLVIPIYKNEANIEPLLEALTALEKDILGLQVVFVIDGSPDNSGKLLMDAAQIVPFDYKVIFLSRNFGSFTAIRTGIEFSEGQFVGVMAADLQEPPELIIKLFEALEKGANVAFGRRISRHDGLFSDGLSKIFWSLYRRLINPEIPAGGVDIFACDRKVIRTLLDMNEQNTSLVGQLFWLGFDRTFVDYERKVRQVGRSSWSFSKKLKYLSDSIFAFSDMPIKTILYVGIVGLISSLGFAIFTAVARLAGLIVVPGYTSLIIFISFISSLILAVQGILGAYLWRAFENTKARPVRVVNRNVRIESGKIIDCTNDDN